MIEIRGLSKRYGDRIAVDDLSFTIRPGHVTGFLGPNGAGKTTTMRVILGLDSPSAGSVSFDGKPFAQVYSAMRKVGALLDAKAVHGGRTAYNHLWCLAATNGIPRSRVDEVIGIVGLEDAAKKRSGGLSLGMSQRLGIAAALLGDPEILMFDEPVNGLDPEGIRWIRLLMRSLAAEGRTVFVSSHLMIGRFLPHLPDPADPPPGLADLTAREHEVLAQAGCGLSNTEIAALLTISETTVKTHIGHIMAKLGLRDRIQIVVYAYETGLITPQGRPGKASPPRSTTAG